MKVILKKDVNGLGYQYDIVSVKPGYGRNYLLPRGLAETATPSAIKVRDEVVKQKAHKEEKLIKDANELAAALENVVLTFKMKTQEAGKTYGSVTAAMIAEAIKEKFSYDVDKNDVKLFIYDKPKYGINYTKFIKHCIANSENLNNKKLFEE